MTERSRDAATELDTTLEAMKGGITAITPSAAVTNIAYWQRVLASEGSLEALAVDLAELKGHLERGDLDGKVIGPLLQRIGDATSGAAPGAPANISPRLRQLGDTLAKIGGSLTK